MTTKIEQVIVVEGRDDTARLRQFFGDVDTIETQGSAVSSATLAHIKQVAQQRELIVLTDPDFNGLKIRQKVMAAVPQAKQAFLPRQAARPHHRGSLGVEHATKADLWDCLQHVVSLAPASMTDVQPNDLVRLGLVGSPASQKRREQVGDYLHIGYGNAKQFLRKLTLFGISAAELGLAVQHVKIKET